MPTYLCHGFRWYRNNVRTFSQFQDIEDAAPDWVIRQGSSHALIYTLYTIFDFLPFAEDLSAVAGEASARRLNKKRSRARFLNRLGMFSSNNSSSSSSAAAAAAAAGGSTCGDFSDDDPLPPPTPLGQPPVIPKILLPPGSETIFLPPGVKPPSMQRPQPRPEEEKARVVRTDPADPVLCNNDWAAIRLLEEWDERAEPAAGDGRICTRPWAYVADYAVRIDLSGRVSEEMTRYERWSTRLDDGTHRPMGEALEDDPAAERAALEAGIAPKKGAAARKRGWFQMLRDNMEPEGAIQWYIVVCDDVVRDFPPAESEQEDEGVGVDADTDTETESELEGKKLQDKMKAVSLQHSRGVGSSGTNEYDTEAESHDGSALIAAASAGEAPRSP